MAGLGHAGALPPSLQAGQFLWLLVKGTVKSPLKWLMRPLGHLPLVSWVQLSKAGCSRSLNCSLILLPHQSRWWICGDRGRDDGSIATGHLAFLPVTLLHSRCSPSAWLVPGHYPAFMLLWGKKMDKIILEVPSRPFPEHQWSLPICTICICSASR